MMFFIICMLGACTAEELAGPESGVEDDAPVVIAISPADITSVNMNSRLPEITPYSPLLMM